MCVRDGKRKHVAAPGPRSAGDPDPARAAAGARRACAQPGLLALLWA